MNEPAAASVGTTPPVSDKGFVAAILLCFFLGAFGVHRFYVGKIGTGILMLITFGGFGIRVLIDFILIVTSSLRDGNGLLIKPPRS